MSLAQVLATLGVPAPSADSPLRTTLMIQDEAQLRDLLDLGLSAEGRAQHAAALLGGITPPADNPHVALVHQLIRHVVGNDPLSEQDRAQLAPAYPIAVQVHAEAQVAPPKVVNYVWDVSTPTGSLQMIDLPNGLVLSDGGCVVAQATPLMFKCASLTRVGACPAGQQGDFVILGRKGADGGTPQQPNASGPAQPGAQGQCTSAGIAGTGGGPGSPGNPGEPGGTGGRGGNGIASAFASITIQNGLTLTSATAGKLVIAAQSGPGGDGGKGGQGGTGQQGGNGGNGMSCGCTGNGGGAAGPGGQGGKGGQGGDGGDGVDAGGNITVYLPASVPTSVIEVVASPAPPGKGGDDGGGGGGGLPGSPGTAGKHNSAGGTAGAGGTGATGGGGHWGTHTGAPAQVSPYIL